MSKEPTAYIVAALSSVGIACRTLDINSYDPMAFGNLEARAETNIGALKIVFDRGFFVESQHADTAIIEKITEALDQHKKAAEA